MQKVSKKAKICWTNRDVWTRWPHCAMPNGSRFDFNHTEQKKISKIFSLSLFIFGESCKNLFSKMTPKPVI